MKMPTFVKHTSGSVYYMTDNKLSVSGIEIGYTPDFTVLTPREATEHVQYFREACDLLPKLCQLFTDQKFTCPVTGVEYFIGQVKTPSGMLDLNGAAINEQNSTVLGITNASGFAVPADRAMGLLNLLMPNGKPVKDYIHWLISYYGSIKQTHGRFDPKAIRRLLKQKPETMDEQFELLEDARKFGFHPMVQFLFPELDIVDGQRLASESRGYKVTTQEDIDYNVHVEMYTSFDGTYGVNKHADVTVQQSGNDAAYQESITWGSNSRVYTDSDFVSAIISALPESVSIKIYERV